MDFNFGFLAMKQAWPAYATFIGMLVGARLLALTPLGLPLRWAETFYHELSHGLMCMFTGGKVFRIQLRFNGSGVCVTGGGFRFLVLLAGYAGASAWGGLLFMVGAYAGSVMANYWLMAELILLGFVLLLWVRDLQTLTIVLLLVTLYGLTLWWPSAAIFRQLMPWLLQFIGLFVMSNALLAPLDLIDGKHVGDGAQLQNMTLILPEIVWISLWFLFGLFVMGWCAAQTLPGFATLTGIPRIDMLNYGNLGSLFQAVGSIHR